jgi:glycosyltransferase involved in cell wall biosynthesis
MQILPRVSVIIPTYNRAILLPRAIQSVLEQDFGDFELVIIDDGSMDETWQVMAQFPDPRIRYIRLEKNQGIGFARGEGVRQSRGELVAFNDSDDVWLPGKLGLQVMIMQGHPQIDILFGDFWNINQVTGEKALGFHQAARAIGNMRTQELEEDVYQVISDYPQALLSQSFMSPPTVMMRKKVFDTIGNFDSELSGPEDFELWWRAAVKNICFALVRKPLIERYKTEQSITFQYLYFIPMKLKALEKAEQSARLQGRLELISFLNQARGRAWDSLIYVHALNGNRMNAWIAFRKSLRYGISLRAVLYFLAALAGPQIISWVKWSLRRFECLLGPG